MERFEISTVTRQFLRSFSEASLNELGKATRLCRREREATPFRLMLALLESFATGALDSIADIHRAFNALCERQMRYKPFHNQLSKPGFALFMRLMDVKARLNRYTCLDLTVRFGEGENSFECRLIVHPNLRGNDLPRYLLTNLEREDFTPQHVSDGYRLRWQVELLFKEWKSHANLHPFDTANPNIAEGLIWASLCAATHKRYCAHATQRIARVAMSTRTVAKCIRHVLGDVFYDLMHHPESLHHSVTRAVEYLAQNATRAHPKRDRKSGRLKLGLVHVLANA